MCGLTGAPRCDIYFTDGDRLRLAVSIDGGELDPGRLGSAWVTAEWTPTDGDPATAPVTCLRATDKGLSRRATAGDAAARLPLPRLGAARAARRARRRHRAQRRRGPRLLAARRGARRPRAGVRRGGRDQAARSTNSRTATGACARAGRPLARGGADARLRPVRPALRAATADGGERRLRRRVARRRRRDPSRRQLHRATAPIPTCATRSSTPAAIRRWSAPSSTTRRWRSPTSATIGSAPTRPRPCARGASPAR